MSSAVVSTPSASIISYLCDSAVLVEILNSTAISFIVMPSLINFSTSRWRGVRLNFGGPLANGPTGLLVINGVR